MKKLIGLILLIFVVWFVYHVSNYVDPSFATSISLKYHYSDKAIDTVITDQNDIATLKGILRGSSFWDTPSCGFTLNTSITFTDGNKSITFCPGCDDGGTFIRINESDRYISLTEEQRKQLDDILRKYGMVFPCV